MTKSKGVKAAWKAALPVAVLRSLLNDSGPLFLIKAVLCLFNDGEAFTLFCGSIFPGRGMPCMSVSRLGTNSAAEVELVLFNDADAIAVSCGSMFPCVLTYELAPCGAWRIRAPLPTDLLVAPSPVARARFAGRELDRLLGKTTLITDAPVKASLLR